MSKSYIISFTHVKKLSAIKTSVEKLLQEGSRVLESLARSDLSMLGMVTQHLEGQGRLVSTGEWNRKWKIMYHLGSDFGVSGWGGLSNEED